MYVFHIAEFEGGLAVVSTILYCFRAARHCKASQASEGMGACASQDEEDAANSQGDPTPTSALDAWQTFHHNPEEILALQQLACVQDPTRIIQTMTC